jgi:hypothetical protein
MFHRKSWITMTVLILGLAIFIPVAQAQRQDFEALGCYAATFGVVHSSPEVAIRSADAKGIMQSTHDSKFLENWTMHTVYLIKVVGGKASWNGLGKAMAPDGEFIIGEFSGDSESGGSAWKIFYGTGKWKGIKGELKGKVIRTGKPIVEGTNQLCEKYAGWIELPK